MLELIIAICATAGIGLLVHGMRMSKAPKLRSTDAKSYTPPTTQALPVATGVELLHRYPLLVHSIRSKTGLSTGNLEAHLMPILHTYAEFVQLLPASESHHHAHPGGLLQHTLEVVDHALTFRRAYVLPLNAQAERINALKHVWTFGVALAALLHDIGKAVSDQRITLYGPNLPNSERLWHPIAGSMSSQHAMFYSVEFVGGRSYTEHARLGVILMQRMVAPSTLAWLSQSDPECLSQVMQVLSDPSCDNTIKKIIKQADSESARLNLLSGPKSRFKSARETPLIELLDQGLARLVASGQLRLNVPGGHGFVWDAEQGYGDLLLVVPRVMDSMREHLSKALEEGARGIPTDNLVVYGSMQDYGRIRPTPDGKAVWRVQIEGIPKTLTVLRFARASETFKTLAEWPTPFEGSIEVVQGNAAEAQALALQSDGGEGEVVVGLETEAMSMDATVQDGEVERPFWMVDDGSVSSTSTLKTMTGEVPVPAARTVTSISAARTLEVSAVEGLRSAGGLMPPIDEPVEPPSQAVKPIKPVSTKRSVPAMKDPTQKNAQSQEALEAFEDWLRLGLKSGHVRYNDGRAALHFHKEADDASVMALLITPAIYQRYAKERDPEKWGHTEVTAIPREAWVPLQSALLKAHEHKSSQEGKIRRTVFKFATKGAGVFQANVLTNPRTLFQEVPEANPYISGEVKAADMLRLLASKS